MKKTSKQAVRMRPRTPSPWRFRPHNKIDATMNKLNMDALTPMDIVPAPPRQKKSSLRDLKKPIGADTVAATVALKAVLPAHLLEDFGRRQAVTLVIQVPTADWCGPINQAFSNLLDEKQSGGGLARREIAKFLRDGSQRDHRPGNGNDDVVEAIAESKSIVGISPAPKKFLPRTLSTAPDHYVTVRPLSGAQVQEVIADVAGRTTRRPPADDLVAGLDLADLAVAIRPGSTIADCTARLRKLSAGRVEEIGNDIPRLEALSGCDEAKEWGLNLAKDIELFRRGKIKWDEVAEVGVTIFGPPGCGKTQLAKSLSRSLALPLISSSYAAFQAHGHLGDLLAEMRRSAAEAVSRAPSLWFVDEIDCFPNRSECDSKDRAYLTAAVTGMLEICERAARPGVTLLGAANDISRCDPALMRSGRFGDRIIEIPLPDEAALCGIFRHHLAGDLASVDLLPFARGAAGANGADVAAFVRSARRLARNENRTMRPDDLLKQMLPEDVRSVPDIRLAAHHEAGHCVAAIVLMGQRVEYVSIVPKRGSGGQTASATLGTDFPTREILEARVLVLLCGRAAEEVCIGAPSIGCSISDKSDLSRATDLVLGMHAAWGLGRTPMVHAQFTDTSALLFTNEDLRRTVEDHIGGLYKRALAFISENTRAIEAIAERLMVARRIEWTEIDSIMQSIRAATVKSVASASIVPDAGGPAPNGKAKSQARRFDP